MDSGDPQPRLSGNRFLDALPSADAEYLTRLADLQTYPSGTILARRGQPIEAVHFPISGAIAHLQAHAGGRLVQVAEVGSDGVSGFEALLGVPRAQFERATTVPLAAFAARPFALQRLYDRSPPFRALLLRYAVASIRLAGIAAACARHDAIEARLARWLLALHECSNDAELRITHDFAARMLGAQRAGVTHAFARLTRSGSVAVERGRVRIVEPGRLRAAACGCWAESRAALDEVYATGRPD